MIVVRLVRTPLFLRASTQMSGGDKNNDCNAIWLPWFARERCMRRVLVWHERRKCIEASVGSMISTAIELAAARMVQERGALCDDAEPEAKMPEAKMPEASDSDDGSWFEVIV